MELTLLCTHYTRVKAIIFLSFTFVGCLQRNIMEATSCLKLAKEVLFSRRPITQVLLFAIFSFLFALPAIRTYQKREVIVCSLYSLFNSTENIHSIGFTFTSPCASCRVTNAKAISYCCSNIS